MPYFMVVILFISDRFYTYSAGLLSINLRLRPIAQKFYTKCQDLYVHFRGSTYITQKFDKILKIVSIMRMLDYYFKLN